ncbi:MAG: hypothetical protein ABEJ03_02290 [Candidatus Nanohaloarchaea archaeon]
MVLKSYVNRDIIRSMSRRQTSAGNSSTAVPGRTPKISRLLRSVLLKEGQRGEQLLETEAELSVELVVRATGQFSTLIIEDHGHGELDHLKTRKVKAASRLSGTRILTPDGRKATEKDIKLKKKEKKLESPEDTLFIEPSTTHLLNLGEKDRMLKFVHQTVSRHLQLGITGLYLHDPGCFSDKVNGRIEHLMTAEAGLV